MSNILTNNPLQDEQFLLALDSQPQKETFARIAALTWEEQPIEYIEGKITGGTINLDGASALRRTISLTMVAYDVNIDNFYQGLNTKVQVEVGVKNTIDSSYPDIIWFKQGIYVLTSFTTSISTNAYSISLQGKDKMCLLNGDIGGNLPASIDFSTEEYVDLEARTTTRYKIPIKDIIKNMVYTYANEPLHNIIINDLESCGYELLEYRGSNDTPLFLLKDADNGIYTNMSVNARQPCYIKGTTAATLGSLPENAYLNKVNAVETNTAQWVTLMPQSSGTTPKHYYVCKVGYGETVGYRRTDLTYAGDLISSIGESITSILDKIKKMLGNFEYFYDIDGRFIFQRQKNNLYQNWNPIQNDNGEMYVDVSLSPLAYTFNDSVTLTSLSHTPTLNNLKNDFSIWGTRKGITGTDIPIHMRYALDIKPSYYRSIAITENEANELKFHYGHEEVKVQNSVTYSTSGDNAVDWREIIYQMACDYYAYNKLDDFVARVAAANPNHYPTGITGYENYYVDIQGFWRQIYDPTAPEGFYNSADGIKRYWNKNVDTNPAALNFWFDFTGEGSSLEKYLVPAIGHRTKVVNDSKIKSIYFKEVPSVLFITDQELMEALIKKTVYLDQAEYTYIRINENLKSFFSISAQGLSAHDKLEELLSTHTYCTEALTINALPVYYLEPNSRIRIQDMEYNIDGEYLVSKISLPLTYNGTMSLTTTKAAETIY